MSSSTPETYYQTVKQCITGINGCYIPLRSLYASNDYFQVCEVATDLMYHNTTSLYNARAEYSPSIPRFGTNIWNNGYLGVMRCNAMYAAIERSPLTEEEKLPLIGEVVVLRAFYYYILTNNFKDVPFYTEEVTDANNDRISTLPRMSASDTRNYLIDELHTWLVELDALPRIKTYAPENEHRIGAAVGFMLAGKMCLWENRWKDAIEFFGYLEDIYGNGAGAPDGALAQYKLSDIKFRNRYTGESIFELPGYAKDYGLRVTNQLASRSTPMRNSSATEGDSSQDSGVTDDDNEMVDLSLKTDVYNGVCIPELGTESRTTSPYRPTDYFWKTLMPPTSTDKRRSTYDPEEAALGNNVLIGEGDNGGYMAWCYLGWNKDDNRKEVDARVLFFSSTANISKRPYLGDKFWCPGMIYTQDSNNLKIFRFAGVLLNLAEAHLRMGDMDKSCAYVNQIKYRAGINPISPGEFADEEELLAEIQRESARELFGEFNRRHDLVRWGIWQDQCINYGGSSLATNVKAAPCLEYYPIPDQQVVLSNGALDNSEYDKYQL